MNLLRPPHQLTATVLGAGTMGAQIAAHLANVGIRTFLLDIPPRDVAADAPPRQRNALALGAIAAMAKAKPAPFMSSAAAQRIVAGNLEDDLERAAAASDLVIEAVVERLDVKQPLFKRLAAAAPPHAVLATNTSGLPIASIAEALPADAQRRVVGLHFFNPPRYMRLLEIVPSRYTDVEVRNETATFGERVLGKGVVLCRDTPNFIGNRIGIAEMLLTFDATFAGGYTVEEVDLLNGPLMGRPKTGSFRLGDLVGIDVAAHVIRNLKTSLAQAGESDPLADIMAVHPTIEKMIERKMLGDKTRGGFYKKATAPDGSRTILSLDLGTLEYRDRIEPTFAELAKVAKIADTGERAAAALRVDGRAGDFLRRVYLPLFNYASALVGEICDTPKQIDDAMCWGYGWKLGPFALWDAVGLAWGVDQLRAAGHEPSPQVLALIEAQGEKARWYDGGLEAPQVWVPADKTYRALDRSPDVIELAARRAAGNELHTTETAGLLDLGDGIACLEFRSKANTIDGGVLQMFAEVFEVLEKRTGFRGLVVGNQGGNFSLGANAQQILAAAEQGDWKAIEATVKQFQDAMMGLRHGPLPVVAAPHAMTLGGGAECVLQSAAVVAHAELYMGLVEAGIGLVPAGGGLKEMVRRASAWAAQVPDGDPYPWLRRAFESCSTGKVSTSAHEAQSLGFLRTSDSIVFQRDHLLARAKQRAIGMAEAGWVAPDPNEPIRVVGAPHGASFFMGAWAFHQAGFASEHDKLVAEKIAHVLSGGMAFAPSTTTAQHLLDLEREAFVSLCGQEKTRARIAHTLKTGKPLRN